jgi:hypothetical protein
MKSTVARVLVYLSSGTGMSKQKVENIVSHPPLTEAAQVFLKQVEARQLAQAPVHSVHVIQFV